MYHFGGVMDFVSIRDLRSSTSTVRNALEDAKDLVVTSNGKPIAVLSATSPSTLDATLTALRQARAQLAVVEMQRRARESGLDGWSLDDVNREIDDARRQRRT